MKTSLQVNKTDYINVDGTPVRVSTLPDDLRWEIETLDKIRQDQNDAAYQYELCELAKAAKQAQIKSRVDALVADMKKTEEPPTESEDK